MDSPRKATGVAKDYASGAFAAKSGMMADRLQVVPTALPAPPYPDDTRVAGWRFFIDVRRVKQSRTWKLCPPSLRPWLWSIWIESWEEIPAGSYPDDDEVIAATIGIDLTIFQAHRKHLMAGWQKHANGRLYHPYVVELVRSRITWKNAEAERKAEYRKKKEAESKTSKNVPSMSHGTDAGHLVSPGQRRTNDDAGVGVGVGVGVSDTPINQSQKIGPRNGTRLPRPWELPPEWLNWAIGSAGIPEDKAIWQSLQFRDYWWSKSGKDARKDDWFATWRSWIRKTIPT